MLNEIAQKEKSQAKERFVISTIYLLTIFVAGILIGLIEN